MKYMLIAIYFIVYFVLNVYENYYRERWKYDVEKYKVWSRKWHSIQFLRWSFSFIFVLIVTLGINEIIMLIPLSAIWWLLYDGALNLLRGKNFLKGQSILI